MSKEKEGAKKPEKRAALGRGLGQLLGGSDSEPRASRSPISEEKFSVATEPALRAGIIDEKPVSPGPSVPDTMRIWHVAIEQVRPNKNQPRKDFPEEALKELVASIKEKGILQPIVARKLENGVFEIIAGERRWRAAQQSGLKEVPVIIKESGNQEALEWALIENIQRQDLNPVEEAEAYAFLMKEYNLTQQQVAEKVGKDRVTVANLLRILNLTTEVRDHIVAGRITLGLGKVLLGVTDPKQQRKLAAKVIKGNLTVRATEKLVQKLRAQGFGAIDSSDEAERANKLIANLTGELQKILGTKVSLDYTAGKGKLSIYYYSDDELNQLVDRVRDSWNR